MFGLSNRDHARHLLKDINLEAQLLAINRLLQRNRHADVELAESIKKLDEEARATSSEYGQRLADLYVDECEHSIFQNAAHSMSAVGMLAPFIESLFVAVFRGLKAGNQSHASSSTPTIQNSKMSDREFWDPHYVFRNDRWQEDLVAGIVRLANFTGLTASLPKDYEMTLKALFIYRNKMFHNGFEWPVTERQKFEKNIAAEGWPSSWFSNSTCGDITWIIYLSPCFIYRTLPSIHQSDNRWRRRTHVETGGCEGIGTNSG